ncbi:hypothetical protein [Cryobacterium cryoconiti]|uniref:IPT/TIG domain-containing protein n=1 Tax=Cryobacterium cryoconiti TaxID=1259239 RepID=A0A4Y8JVQ4_9MICO|nr:hypothetical protein [Cryobacterium cryoconiti]TFD30673.1 hypothetical protein E3T49_07380 [Cryobacterium cryoconiti]
MRRVRSGPLLALLLPPMLALGLATDTGAGARASAGPLHSERTALAVDAPASAEAGRVLTVAVSGAGNGSTVRLIAIGSLGQIVLTATATADTARFHLPVAFTRTAGSVTLVATSAGFVAHGTTELLAGTAVGPVQAVVGARSIVADGADASMVVTIPVDVWGNAVAEGSPVQFFRQNPDGTQGTSQTTMTHLLAFANLLSGTRAGRGTVWVSVGTVSGPAVSLDEVAGPPEPFTLEPVEPLLAGRAMADGQTLVPVRTSVLRDRFGNVEPDGTQVTVEWSGAEGPARATAVTIAGVAQISVQAPSTPGDLQITGFCRGVASAGALVLPFSAAVGDFPVTADLRPAAVNVTVGPVTGYGGSLVPDGTPVSVSVTDETGPAGSRSGGLVNGTADVVVPSRKLVGRVTVTVSVLGAQTEKTLR